METHEKDATPDELALAVGGIVWKGCAPRSPGATAAHCFEGNTVDAADPVAYRHFAVDDENLVAYFCDRSPTLGRMLCYKCDLADPALPAITCKGNSPKPS